MEMVLQLFRCAQEETITFFRVLKCALDHFSLVLPDNAAQIIAVQCHEEESTFPRRETEHRCQKSEEILHIRRVSPCEQGFIQTRCLDIVRTCCRDDRAGKDWNCGLCTTYCRFHDSMFFVYILRFPCTVEGFLNVSP